MHLVSLFVRSKKKQAGGPVQTYPIGSHVTQWPPRSERVTACGEAGSGLQRLDCREEGEREWGKQMNKTLWFCAALTSVNTTLFTHKSSVNRWGEWHTFTQKHKDVEHETDMLMFSFQRTINGLTHKVPLSWPIYRPSSVLIRACKLEPTRRDISQCYQGHAIV